MQHVLVKFMPAMTTPESCEACGMPKGNQDECMQITLLFSKASNQVMCVEVGKEFVDMLMGFLTLPLSCMVRVLTEGAMLHKPGEELKTPPGSPGSSLSSPGRCSQSNPHFAFTGIANIFDSVAKMEDDKMAVDKSTLLNAKPTFPFGAGKLLNTKGILKEGEELVHPDSGMFSCGAACTFYTAVANSLCPKHKKPMNKPIKLVEDAPVDPNAPVAAAAAQSIGGYVNPNLKFMVTNQLEIFSSSSLKALITLEKMRSERVGDLATREVTVVPAEVLQLLKASLLSVSVMNDVFHKYCSEPTPHVPKVDGKDLSPDSCSERPCCQCSKSGAPLHKII